VGLALGEVASLAQTGIGPASLQPISWLPVLAVIGIGATALAAGVAEMVADASARAPRAWLSWVPALVLLSVVFAAALWVGTVLETPLSIGWAGVKAWLGTEVRSWLVLAAVGSLALATAVWAWAGRGPSSSPRWLLEDATTATWPHAPRGDLGLACANGALAGTLAAASLAIYRAVAGPATTAVLGEQRIYLWIWAAGAAALAAALATSSSVGSRGPALGAIASIVACLVTVAGQLALNTALDGDLTPRFAWDVARQPLALSFCATLVAAPAGLWAWRRPPPLAALAATAALTLALTGVLLHERASLLPALEVVDTPVPTRARAIEEQLYVAVVAPTTASVFRTVEREASAIDAQKDLSGPARATRIRNRIVRPLETLRKQLDGYRFTSPGARTANAAATSAVRSSVRSFELFAQGFAAGDENVLTRARAAQDEFAARVTRWVRAVQALERPGGG
jgi:hypothetical protein